MFTFTAKQFFSFTLLPGIIPRLKQFVSSGLGPIPGIVAHIFRAARLLPAGHPYLLAQNTGKFGLRHVLIAGAANLRFTRANIDQVIIYFSVVAGFILLFMQAALFCLALLMPSARAADDFGKLVTLPTFTVNAQKTYFFSIDNAKDDLAFVLMDRVFGVPGIFVDRKGRETCVATNQPCFGSVQASDGRPASSVDPETSWPWPAHNAMKGLFQFYSMGLLVIAATILFYYIAAVSVETAQSGTPFGKRFNHVWAPLRIVLALGLLIPTSSGLNVAQYLVLYSAKFGSAMATNAWISFSNVAIDGQTEALASNSSGMVVMPPMPKLTTLGEFMTVSYTCRTAYKKFKKIDVDAYVLVKDSNGKFIARKFTEIPYDAAITQSAGSTAKKVADLSDLVVRIGYIDEKSSRAGKITPVCGELSLPTFTAKDGSAEKEMQQRYYEMVRSRLWSDERQQKAADGFVSKIDPSTGTAQANPFPQEERYKTLWDLELEVKDIVYKAALSGVDNNAEWKKQLKSLGWGGAGIWYNKIAQMNGSMISVSQALPSPQNMPALMELVRDSRRRIDGVFMGRDAFRPVLDKQGAKISWPVPDEDSRVAQAMWEAYDSWSDAGEKPSGNVLVDAIKSFFGLTGLFELVNGDNAKKHPMAQLSAIGKGMVDASIAHLTQSGIAFAFGAAGAMTGVDSLMSIGFGVANMLFVVATIGMTVGFLLFYIIPILPFLYFFFAVANWVKSIFEAMIGVPLWALAHLRIDGHNLAGDQAMGGYNLLFEIFLRPILIVFALLGSIVVFSAQAEVLRGIWGELTNVVQESSSIDPPKNIIAGMRSDAIDNFFFLIVYALLLYMIANASFKMIDIIPRSILRWMGVSADVFDDGSGDLAGDLVRHTATGVGTASTLMRGTMGSATGEISAMRAQLGNIDKANKAEKAAGGEDK